MKKIIALALIIVTLGCFCAQAKKNADGKAEIKFTEYRHDMGTVKEKGGPVSCEFQFTNTGDGNLVIVDAKATCGCTRPEYPKNPIAPGKSGKIKVTYNPLARVGAIDRTVTVTTNGNPKKVRLHIVGNVVAGK